MAAGDYMAAAVSEAAQNGKNCILGGLCPQLETDMAGVGLDTRREESPCCGFVVREPILRHIQSESSFARQYTKERTWSTARL